MYGRMRQWLDPDELARSGTTPDYRFSLANERTFLAWIRTGLTLVGGGLAVAQFLPDLRPVYLKEVLAAVLMLLGAACAVRAVDHWARCERAMRHRTDLPVSRFPMVLALAIAVGAVLLMVVVLIGGTR